MTTEEIVQKSWEVNGVQGAFLANKNGIAFMFFDQDFDRIGMSHPTYRKEINLLIDMATKFSVLHGFTFSIR